ncbi:MAG: hypothetical protein ACOZCO_11405 [Bacteroidota bacterium]
MDKYNRISEIFWLITAIACVSLAVYIISIKGFEIGKWYFFISLLAVAMYLTKRMLRIRFEKTKREAEEKLKKKKE